MSSRSFRWLVVMWGGYAVALFAADQQLWLLMGTSLVLGTVATVRA